MAHKLTHLSAVELARLVRTKKASPVEVVEAHLAAIERINPAVNAFCTVAAEKALAWARAAERAVKKRAKLKPLHGVPVAIKDLTLTAGIVAKHPAAMPWHDQSVAGPMARSAEDCALLLDAMTGLSGKSPLSAPAPWKSARDVVAKARSLRGLRLAYAPDIAGIGVDEEIERICRTTARDLRDDGAALEEIEFNLADGRDAFLALRGEAMVGNHFDRLERIGELGDNLAGNIRAGLALTISEIARAER